VQSAFFTLSAIKYRDRNRLRDRLHRLEAQQGESWPVDDPERVELNLRIKSLGQKGGDYLAYGLTALLVSMLDSYVSAHLYRFERNFQVYAGRGIEVSMRF